MRTHQELDQRSLALHRLIADKIRQDPRLFDKPRQTLARWRTAVSPNSQAYVQDWLQLIDSGVEVCLAIATQESERANALRQASPFSGVLTHKERFAFFKNWAQEHHETRRP